MAATSEVLTVLEKCQISPPPTTVGERTLPLTFFDLVFLVFSPAHQLFFYEFLHSKAHFLQTVIPNLKHSLSITLQHFFPFASNLIVFSDPSLARKPEIRHVEGDSVVLTFAECTLDFNDLTGNHPRDCHKFYPLVPQMGSALKVSDFVKIPIFSVQVTFFPNLGISIGLTYHHALCDASSTFGFLRAWTSIAKYGTDELFTASGCSPFYDRMIKYPSSLEEILLTRLGIQTLYSDYKPRQLVIQTDRIRATLVLTRSDINRLKKWVSTELPKQDYVSSFSVACAFVWSCMAKSRERLEGKKGDDELERFRISVDCRARLDPPLPQTYFGNCLGPCMATTKSNILTGNKGFLAAAELLGKALNEMLRNKDGMIKDAETWLEKILKPVPTMGVAGTPKLKIYDMDFGWGKPKKYETISLDYSISSISVNASRDSPEDLEIGLSLPAKQMDAFIAIARNELESIISEQK